MIKRFQTKEIEQLFFKGKAIILSGARQVGKTTLLESILDKYQKILLSLDADDIII